MPPGLEADFLAPIPVEEVPEIEPRLAQELQRLGVRTLGQITEVPERELQRRFRDRGLIRRRHVSIGFEHARNACSRNQVLCELAQGERHLLNGLQDDGLELAPAVVGVQDVVLHP